MIFSVKLQYFAAKLKRQIGKMQISDCILTMFKFCPPVLSTGQGGHTGQYWTPLPAHVGQLKRHERHYHSLAVTICMPSYIFTTLSYVKKATRFSID